MNKEYIEVEECRLCSSKNFQEVVDLGSQCYTGQFLEINQKNPVSARLAIKRCTKCGLVQLKDSYPDSEMYGESYGYRSSITDTMRKHLKGISEYALKYFEKDEKLNILDIGSNDGTLLSFYDNKKYSITGIDPCANKHKNNYPADALIINNFFSKQNLKNAKAPKLFNIVTSIAMFYDLDDPVLFAKNIYDVLEDDGIWITEQTHSHTLLDTNCYDSICHEHVTYLSLSAMEEICKRAGLKILEITTNDINGGSFRLLISKVNSGNVVNDESINDFRHKELTLKLNDANVWEDFHKMVAKHKDDFQDYFHRLKMDNKVVLGYGASTKGNVLLQYCEISKDDMPVILERDPNKFGMLTPGSRIPIISEEEGRNMKPDVLVVFPWHFRDEIIKREKDFLLGGGSLIFPLPNLEVVTKEIFNQI